MKSYDLEDRFVSFAGNVIITLRKIKRSLSNEILMRQLIRSSTGSALNFAESLGSYSKKDKIFKLSICLKELKESRVNIKILIYTNLNLDNVFLDLLDESNQLSAIVSSIMNKNRN